LTEKNEQKYKIKKMKDIEKMQSVKAKAQLLVEMESSTAHFTAFLLANTFTTASNALQEGEEPLAGTFLCDLSGTKAYEFYGKLGENWGNDKPAQGSRAQTSVSVSAPL
jgi:hypothetical protein